MTIPEEARRMYADKASLLKILEEQDKKTGFVVNTNATAQKARELMLAQGIRPEDNEFSCEIKRMREGECGSKISQKRPLHT